MTTVYDIIKGISQAAANAYDGSHDGRFTSDGKATKVGLKREEGCPIVDSRVMDGFGVKFSGNLLIVSYHSELPLDQVHGKEFETDIERNFKDISKFLKKEYKKITKKELSLASKGDASIHVQSISRLRSWVQATKTYKIGKLKEVESIGQGTPEDLLDDSIKKWLAIGKKKYPKAKKPENVSTK